MSEKEFHKKKLKLKLKKKKKKKRMRKRKAHTKKRYIMCIYIEGFI